MSKQLKITIQAITVLLLALCVGCGNKEMPKEQKTKLTVAQVAAPTAQAESPEAKDAGSSIFRSIDP